MTEQTHHHRVILVVLRHADVDPLVVIGAIGIVEGVGNVLTRFRIRSTELRCADTDVAAPNSASIEVGYDLLTLAGTGAIEERRDDTGCQHVANIVVAECLRSDCRRLAVLTENVCNATTSSPADCVETGAVLFRTILAITAHLSPDEGRELFVKRLIVETHLVKSFVTQIVHEDICVSKKLLHELHAFFVLQIDRNEVLVGVVKVDRRIFHVGLLATKARTLSTLSITVGRLDLDDRCTHFRETTHTSRSSYPFAEFNNFNASEWAIAIELFCS